jgi:hypothetical protein
MGDNAPTKTGDQRSSFMPTCATAAELAAGFAFGAATGYPGVAVVAGVSAVALGAVGVAAIRQSRSFRTKATKKDIAGN